MECVYKKQGFFIYKLIPCLIITMFAFMCLYGSNVYATGLSSSDIDTTNVTISLDGHNFNVPKGIFDYYDSFLFVYTTGASYPYRIFYGLGDIYVETRDYYYYYCCNEGIGLVTSQDGTFTANQYESSDVVALETENGANSRSADNFLLCTNDLILDDTSTLLSSSNICDIDGNMVFQVAPQSTLAPIVEQQEMKPLQEILGILPVVIVVLVGLIALRKAILFLIARMKKA